MHLELFGTLSLKDIRRRSTWHDWRHRDDVPEMLRFVSGLALNNMARFMAFLARQRSQRTESSEMNSELVLELECVEIIKSDINKEQEEIN